MTIIIFLAVLFVLILVHEWGHFIVAKRTGMQVDEFGIGFPPTLFGYKWHDTLYTFNLLPIGGFVKILGEDGDPSGTINQKSFTRKSRVAQTAVLLAGVIMNILFAWLLFAVVFMVGVPRTVSEVNAGPSAELMIRSVNEGSPAETAGILAGATVISISDGTSTYSSPTPREFAETISQSTSVTLVYELGDNTKTVSIEPQIGLSSPDRQTIGVGISLVETVKESFFPALYEATLATGSTLIAVVTGVYDLLKDTISGQADLTQIAGPVGIAGMAGEAASFGLTSLLLFTAFISLNLAVINLLPFPALDGGRVLIVMIEGVIRRPLNPVWTSRLNFVGIALLLLLMILVTYNDIVNL